LAGTIVDGKGFVNSGDQLRGALKPLEKAGNIMEILLDAGRFTARAPKTY
jgi:hypothetical protein